MVRPARGAGPTGDSFELYDMASAGFAVWCDDDWNYVLADDDDMAARYIDGFLYRERGQSQNVRRFTGQSVFAGIGDTNLRVVLTTMPIPSNRFDVRRSVHVASHSRTPLQVRDS